MPGSSEAHDSHLNHLIKTYSEARAVLSDAQFSSDISAYQDNASVKPSAASPPGFFINMNPPDHTRYRRAIAGYFTLRRTEGYRATIEKVTETYLTNVSETSPPVDLGTTFIYTVPFQVMCDILGIPQELQSDVRELTACLTDMRFSQSDSALAHQALIRLFAAISRSGANDDSACLLSQLVGKGATSDGLTPEEVGGVGVMLLNAGHETTAGVFSLGLIELFRHPGQLRFLRENVHRDTAVERAVEEMLRYCSPLRYGLPRISTKAAMLGDHRISPGDLVTISTERVNRDGGRFPDPDMFDIRRDRLRHLAFGHGIHQCVGSELARLELRVMLRGLLSRFPEVNLAIHPTEVQLLQNTLLRGCTNLPVTL